MQVPPLGKNTDRTLAELVAFSSRVEVSKRNQPARSHNGRPLRLLDGKDAAGRSRGFPNISLPASFASPLAPLRTRDTQALEDIFGKVGLEDVEADIDNTLQAILPTPCWEDDPFDFLLDYI